MADVAAKKYNKVIYGGKVLIDLTGDTVTPADLAKGVIAHDKSGAEIEGTSTKDSDTSADTAAASEILKGKTAHVKGKLVTGSMPNNGAVSGTINTVAGKYTIPQGHHDGSGTVEIAPTEQAKIVAKNIRQGVIILGVTGTMSTTEGLKAQAKTATPKTTKQTIIPDETYNALSQVEIAAIPYTETDNDAGGLTASIAG